jgi:hypothetical protein
MGTAMTAQYTAHDTAQAQRRSLTGDPLLLHDGVFQRVDTTHLPPGAAGAAATGCRTDVPLPQPGQPAAAAPTGCTHDCEQGDRCTCAQACSNACPSPIDQDLIDRLGLDQRPLLSLALILFGVLVLIQFAPQLLTLLSLR